MKKQKGFTLIELLVVVAIIAVLISILLPALSTAREKGRQALCASNLKQINVAWAMYLNAYNDSLPPYASFADRWGISEANDPSPAKVLTQLWPYIMRSELNTPAMPMGHFAIVPTDYRKGILTCPSMRTALFYLWGAHYAMPKNSIGGDNWNANYPAYRRYSQVANPAQTLAFADCENPYQPNYGGWVIIFNDSNPTIINNTWGYVSFRHAQYANALFADGHAESKSYGQLYAPYPAWLWMVPWGNLY